MTKHQLYKDNFKLIKINNHKLIFNFKIKKNRIHHQTFINMQHNDIY